MMLRQVITLGASVVLVLALHGPRLVDANFEPRQADTDADAMVPVVADIQKLRNARLTVGQEEVRATISYYQHGTTIVLLPVWVAEGEVELLLGEGATARRHKVGSDQPLLPEGISDRARLRVHVRDLLSQEEARKAIHKKLTENLQETGALTEKQVPQIRPPRINERRYQVTLCTSGSRDIPEVELSATAVLPPAAVEEGGVVELEVLPKGFVERRARAGEVKLQDTYLRITGLLWCRMEREEVRATVGIVSKAIVEVQHQLGSDPAQGDRQPVTVVQVAGGKVEMSTTLTRMVTQCAGVSLMTREGARQKPDLVFQLAQELFRQQLKDLRATDLEDGRLVSFLVGNLATLSGTVGEIKELARKDRKEREQALKAAWGVRARLRLGPLAPEVGDRKAVEITSKALDEVAEFFAGNLPTLTGIHFAQRGATAADSLLQGVINQGSFRTGWVPHDWPYVRFATRKGEPVVVDVPKKREPKVVKMADCVGSWKLQTGEGSIDMDLKSDGTAAFTDRPDKGRPWGEGGGLVSAGKGIWSVDSDGRLTASMTHVWIGVFWKEHKGTWVTAEKINEVTPNEIVLLSGARLRRR